jgi:hypothetical protein
VGCLTIPFGCKIPANVERKDWLGSGKIGTLLVPDYIWGISMKKAGYIHDWCYQHQVGKKKADKMFLHNMNVLIDNAIIHPAIKSNAMIVAKYYYQAVNWFGGSAYKRCKRG